MASIIKSVSDTTTNVLDTVGTVAQQLTNTVNTAGRGLDMLNAFVTKAHTEQAMRHDVAKHTFMEELLEETSIQNAERQERLQQKLSNNNTLKTLFTEQHAKLSAVLSKYNTPTE